LRGIAALWVLLGHCALLTGWALPVIDKPDLGVDLFMMLSGFLMVFHYHLRAGTEPWGSPRTWVRFWIRRYFRVAPLYYVMLAAALIAGPAILSWRTAIDQILHQATLTSPEAFIDHSPRNIAAHLSFVFGLLPTYAMRTPLPDWSLTLEMQFYALFPALMLLTRKLGWVRGAGLAALAGAVITHVIWHYSIHFPMPSFLPLRIDIFFAGMLLAQADRVGQRTAMFYLVLALLLALQPFQGEGSLERLVVREILVLAFFALTLNRFLPAPGGEIAGKLAAILGRNPFRWLGEISYSVYLLHLPIMAPVAAVVLLHFGHGAPAPFLIAFLAVAVLVYPMAWLTHRFIEIPGQAAGRLLLRRLSRKAIEARTDQAESLTAL
jgi:peptidoglycan/LPS O-acetylase OafA/YrhL